MKCQAKITDNYGCKYTCLEEATKKITITTFAPHLNKEISKYRCLCTKHAHRLKNRHNYKIKHLGKQTTIKEELL